MRTRIGNAWIWLAALVVVLAGLGVAATRPGWNGESDGTVRASVQMDRNQNKIFDTLDLAIASADAGQTFPVIVVTETPVDAGMVAKILGASIQFRHTYQFLPGFAADLIREQIQLLAGEPWVIQIEPDAPVQTLLESASRHHGVTAARADFGVDGDGDGEPATYSPGDVVIAVIDTGVAWSPPTQSVREG